MLPLPFHHLILWIREVISGSLTWVSMTCTWRVSICTVFNTEPIVFLPQSCISYMLVNGFAHHFVPSGQKSGSYSRFLPSHHPWQSMIIMFSWCCPKYSLNPFPSPHFYHHYLSTGPPELLPGVLPSTWVSSSFIFVKPTLHIVTIGRYLKCKPSFIHTMPVSHDPVLPSPVSIRYTFYFTLHWSTKSLLFHIQTKSRLLCH